MECGGDGDSSIARCGGVSRETPPIAPITSDGRSTARSGRDRGAPPDLGSESVCIRHTGSRMSSSLSASGREKSTDGGSSMSAGHLVPGAIRHNRFLSQKRRGLRPYLHGPRATLLRSIALKHRRSPRPVSRQVGAASTRPHASTYARGVLLTSCRHGCVVSRETVGSGSASADGPRSHRSRVTRPSRRFSPALNDRVSSIRKVDSHPMLLRIAVSLTPRQTRDNRGCYLRAPAVRATFGSLHHRLEPHPSVGNLPRAQCFT